MRKFVLVFVVPALFGLVLGFGAYFIVNPPSAHSWLDVLQTFSTLLVGVGALVISILQYLSSQADKSLVGAEKRWEIFRDYIEFLGSIERQVRKNINGDSYQVEQKELARIKSLLRVRFDKDVYSELHRLGEDFLKHAIIDKEGRSKDSVRKKFIDMEWKMINLCKSHMFK